MSGVKIKFDSITKSFPGVYALRDVSFEIKTEEIHAVVGENGAGKSTLMKILGGVYIPDKGKIYIDDELTNIKSIQNSKDVGISVIYQEFNLMSELTVAENIFVTDLPKTKIGFVHHKKLFDQTIELLKQLDIKLNPRAFIKDLTVSEQQMVEIAKALSHSSEIIIMDEPTASLNNNEVDKLFTIIRKLKENKKTIIYISHRLKEIFMIANRVTVLRDGQYVGTRLMKKTDEDSIVRMMVGRDINSFFSHTKKKAGENILSVKNLTRKDSFEKISFDLAKGEILGIAGLMGCGRESLVRSIYGLEKYDEGSIYLKNKPVKISNPCKAMNYGLEFLTEDRKNAGILEKMGVAHNLTLNIIKSLSFLKMIISSKKEAEVVKYYTDYMHLKYATSSQQLIYLSGGNQQKVLLSRALASKGKILLLLEPTRGVDVGAKQEIYHLLAELSGRGMTIIMVSSDLPELIMSCHRILVMWQGQLVGNLIGKDIEEETIMSCATGNKKIFSEVTK